MGVGWPKAPRAVPAIMAIAIPKMRAFKCRGIRAAIKISRNFILPRPARLANHPIRLWLFGFLV